MVPNVLVAGSASGSAAAVPKAKAGAGKRALTAGAVYVDTPPKKKTAAGDDLKKRMAKDLLEFKAKFNRTTGSGKNLLTTIKSDKSWVWEKDHKVDAGLDTALKNCDRVNEEPFMAALLSLDSKEFLNQYGEKNFKVIRTLPERGG